VQLWGFLTGRTYNAPADNSLLPGKTSKAEEINARTVGVDASWLKMLTHMKSQVCDERGGDLAIDATVAESFANKLATQGKKTQVVVIDEENDGEFALSSDVAALIDQFESK